MSPWNRCVFVIHKPNGTWRILQDLGAINAHMELVGTPLRGLPWASTIPSQFHLTAIGLKDCFSSIPLHEEVFKKFTFSIPTVKSSRPDERYEWAILPQRMANSPTLFCQHFYSIVCSLILAKIILFKMFT